MELFIQISQFVLSLSILIVLHELGHMLPAKYFKTKVEKFYLFFDAGFSLFKFKKGETEYGIGWIPLGGYVKIAGMIDESMDKEQMKEPAKPWEFRSKPTWQRLIIMVGGVTVNLLLGFLIYIMILFVWGKDYVPNEAIKYGAHLSNTKFADYGFQDGDLIVEVGGSPINEFGDATSKILIDGERELKIRRENQIIPVTLNDSIVTDMLRLKVRGIFSDIRFPNVIGSVMKGSFAELANLQRGDSVVGINGQSTPYFLDFKREIERYESEEVELQIVRNEKPETIKVQVAEDHTIGYFPKNQFLYFDYKHKDYGLVESIPTGVSEGVATLGNYVKSLGLLFNKEGAKQIGGFGTIGGLFSPYWDWKRFWSMTALLSIILAFMNILPIPALDGGHVMFLIYEMISGKPPSDQFLTRAQIVGMSLLLALLVYANGMDIYRWISG